MTFGSETDIFDRHKHFRKRPFSTSLVHQNPKASSNNSSFQGGIRASEQDRATGANDKDPY
jgi:hypothetical protein